MGRPTTYKPGLCEEFLTRRAAGETLVMIAADWNTTPQTMWNWSKAHDDFLDAFTRGRLKFIAFYERTAINNFTNPKFKTDLFKFWMTNKCDFVEHSSDKPLKCKDLGKDPDGVLTKMLEDGEISPSVYATMQNALTKRWERENGDKAIAAAETLQTENAKKKAGMN